MGLFFHLLTPDFLLVFFGRHRGQPIASSALLSPLTRDFVSSIERFVKTHSIPLITFAKGQDKDEIATEYRFHFTSPEGVVSVGYWTPH